MNISYIPKHVEQLTIMNVPEYYKINDNRSFIVRSKAETDFWLKTHYGFEVMNGHVFYNEMMTDFQAEVQLCMDPNSKYDQAGLFVMISEKCWLKTSLEYIPDGPSHLGAVVTNNGYSDWSTQDFPTELATQQLHFRIVRKRGNYIIYVKNSCQWEQIRIAHLMEDIGNAPVKIGFYTCSPSKNNGFETEFLDFTIEEI
ncbi:hypothetical protein A6279_06835 [Bacillus wiedmannii]|uniref:DUF1349 domain-containing protein n=2 Tax=Bacillus cereus group TaxID=86661 RepID=A0AB73RDA8_9BACI|nr:MULTISPECIES: DUF1349 domain-containing protein [Bacillus]KAA0769285.1 DUF1349 domain-containing protein [Bacillus sp. BB51/4]KXY05416.1 hypothetical protein AT260_14470 [Bacillus wiedmannii]MBJ8084432.1 DUF1349 domain-containing protein [Bacillus cereus group sp. N14]MDI6676855.1 DUF1349 domain-containing protein [Bacillus wiedmannii]OAK07122.1 hypothetical protein A6279_06835 [Bacillus wiedmannii]